ARTGAIKARTQTANQLRDLLVTAPEELHTQLYPLSTAKRVQRLVAQQPAGGADPASATTGPSAPGPGARQALPAFVGPAPGWRRRPGQRHHRALCHLPRRHQALTAELAALNADL